MSEQDILNFCEITGATPSDAQNFLEVKAIHSIHACIRNY